MDVVAQSLDGRRTKHLAGRALLAYAPDPENTDAAVGRLFDAIGLQGTAGGGDAGRARGGGGDSVAVAPTSSADLQGWCLGRLLSGEPSLDETLLLLWHSHFATAASEVRSAELMLRQHLFVRANCFDFARLLRGLLTDGAML